LIELRVQTQQKETLRELVRASVGFEMFEVIVFVVGGTIVFYVETSLSTAESIELQREANVLERVVFS